MATTIVNDHADVAFVREKWGWFLLLGATMVAAGMVALICTTTTTLVTIMFLGWFLAISGGVQLIETFAVRSWSGFLMHLMTAIFQTIVGIMILGAPVANAVLITFMFAVFLMVNGLFRLIAGLRLPVVGALVSLSGFASFVLGVLIWRQWPESSLWFIGFFVALDLIMHGASWIAFALQARGLPRTGETGAIPAAA